MWGLAQFWVKFANHVADPHRPIRLWGVLILTGLGSFGLYPSLATAGGSARPVPQLSPLSPLANPAAPLEPQAAVAATLAPTALSASGSPISLALVVLVLFGLFLTISLVRWRRR